MKILKSITSLMLTIAMLVSFCVFSSATGDTVLLAKVEDGIVTLTVADSDAEGMLCFDSVVAYDATVLKIMGSVKNGPYCSQYLDCGETVITGYNTNEVGLIRPGIILGNKIYDDATFAEKFKENECEGTPVSTKNMVLFTVKFSVIDADATSTIIDCGSSSIKINLKRALPAYKLCDVNNDSYIKVDDARLALRASIRLEAYNSDSVAFLAADVNSDKYITVDDARIILRTAIGLDEPSCGHDFANVDCRTEKYCTNCGVKLGTKGAHSYSAATCISAKKCTVCGATNGKALGHNYSAASCTTPAKCTRCGATDGKALGHNYSAASCTSPAKCTRCGATDGKALGHSWDAGYVSKQPSCTTEGTRTYKCTRCGTTKNETIPGTGSHAWNNGTITKYPTSAKEGVITKTCYNCGKTTTVSVPCIEPTTADYDILKCMLSDIDSTISGSVYTYEPNSTNVYPMLFEGGAIRVFKDCNRYDFDFYMYETNPIDPKNYVGKYGYYYQWKIEADFVDKVLKNSFGITPNHSYDKVESYQAVYYYGGYYYYLTKIGGREEGTDFSVDKITKDSLGRYVITGNTYFVFMDERSYSGTFTLTCELVQDGNEYFWRIYSLSRRS